MKFWDLLKKGFFYLLALFVPIIILSLFLSQNIIQKINLLKTKPLSKVETKALPWLKTEGRYLINEKNEQVILRGVNIASVDWGYETWHPEAISHLANEWKINVIRIRVIQADFEKNEEEFFQKLEGEFLIPARQEGLYVIIHPRVRNNKTDLPDNQTTAMWKAIAEKYQNDPNILYDPLAEPHNTSQEAVVEAYHHLIDEIRAIHSRSLIFVTGLSWGREINPYAKNPLPYENLVYRSNPYNTPNKFAGLFGEIAQTQPVFLGEFGADGYPPMSQEDVKALLDYANQLEIGWTAWNFHSIGCPCLLNDYKNFEPSDYGLIIKEALVR